MGGFTKLFKIQYQPMGFSWMVFADRTDFDRSHYDFHYVQREFLGDVRCLIFDVTPKKNAGTGRFHGRIWVEDQDYNIVRVNGTYCSCSTKRVLSSTWIVGVSIWCVGYWMPAYIYSEEGDFRYGSSDKMAFKAQTRHLGLPCEEEPRDDELTEVNGRLHGKRRKSGGAGCFSAGSAVAWQQQAETTSWSAYTNAGLLAPQAKSTNS